MPHFTSNTTFYNVDVVLEWNASVHMSGCPVHTKGKNVSILCVCVWGGRDDIGIVLFIQNNHTCISVMRQCYMNETALSHWKVSQTSSFLWRNKALVYTSCCTFLHVTVLLRSFGVRTALYSLLGVAGLPRVITERSVVCHLVSTLYVINWQMIYNSTGILAIFGTHTVHTESRRDATSGKVMCSGAPSVINSEQQSTF